MVNVVVAPPALTVTTPERLVLLVFGATVMESKSPLTPEDFERINQGWFDEAVQLAWLVPTNMLTPLPLAGRSVVIPQPTGVRLTVAGAVVPPWVTVSVATASPARTVTVPVRPLWLGLAAVMTEKDCPLVPAEFEMVSHDWFDVAVQMD